jgi:hypothetical protein
VVLSTLRMAAYTGGRGHGGQGGAREHVGEVIELSRVVKHDDMTP